MRSGVKDRKPPYAEPLVRWCERSVNTKVGDKHLRLVFTSYSIVGDRGAWTNRGFIGIIGLIVLVGLIRLIGQIV